MIQEVRIVKTVDRHVLDDVLKYVWQVDSKVPLVTFYRSGHSPIYTQRFMLYCLAQKSVFEQLRTHEKNGCQFFCDSARPDFGNNKGANSRDSLRHFAIDCNAKHIMDMASKRLCARAEKPTRKFMQLIKKEMQTIDADLAQRMLVQCVLSSEGCKEFKSCGYRPYTPLDMD